MSLYNMGGSSNFPTMDYSGAAGQQGKANNQTAFFNTTLSNPNINNPLGSRNVSYSYDPQSGTYQPTVNDTLNPIGQKTLEAQQGTDLAMANYANAQTGALPNQPFQNTAPDVQTSLDTSGIAKMPINAGMTGQQAIMSRLQPQLDTQRQQLQTQMANQGIAPGTEAWNNAMREQNQRENDLMTSAVTQGLNLDMSANQQGYSQALNSGNFANTASGEALSRAAGLYGLPLNYLNASRQGSQVQLPQFQGFSGSSSAAPPYMDAAKLQSEQNIAASNAKTAQNNALMKGLFDLGSTFIQYG
jgi:hypothetical protein